jgi:polyphosphate kinase 2
MSKHDDVEFPDLHLALIKVQQDIIAKGRKLLVIFEGRDAAGKDGNIRRLVEHLSARQTRVVALPKPSDTERGQWFLQRYVAHLPSSGEIVVFNRSWYNRAGVERVMGFSKPDEQEQFLRDIPGFEHVLQANGVMVVKFWLDITRKEQARRLEERRTDPLKVFKTSPLDAAAQEKWEDYSRARNEMLLRTHSVECPWVCVLADNKSDARQQVLRSLIRRIGPQEVAASIPAPDEKILFEFEHSAISDGRLAL